jgi:hypothetical protein
MNGRENSLNLKVKTNVKLSLCLLFSTDHNAMKAYWGVEV